MTLKFFLRNGSIAILALFLLCSFYKLDLKMEIDSLNTRAWESQIGNPIEAISLSKKALQLADSIQYVQGLSTSSNYLGIFYYKKSAYSKAEKYFLDAIDHRKVIGYEEGVAYVYGNLCGLRWQLGDYLGSINYGFRALTILQKLGLAESEPDIYINLGIAHHDNGDFKDAQKYYKKGLEIAEVMDDTSRMLMIHFNYANLYKKMNKIDTAEAFYKKALLLNETVKNKSFEGKTFAGLANIAIERKEYSKALGLFKKSIKINLHLHDSIELFENYIEQSELYLVKHSYKKALDEARKAEIYLGDIRGDDEHEKLNRQFAIIHEGLKDYKNSFFYLKKAENYKDSIFSTAKSRSIALSQKENAEREKAEAEKAKAEEELKNQQLTQSLLLAGILSLGLLFGLYVINQRRIQKSRELTDFKDQQERVIDQRIIGATQEIRKELARNLHNHVATPLTHIKRFIEPIYQQLSFDPEWQANLMQALQIADKAHVVSRDISYQLKPEKIDWVDRIKISMVALEKNKTMRTNLEAKGLTDIAFTKIEGEKISSIIGNLLSNVDKHSKATEVKVNITQSDRHLNIEVVDNGVGFKPQEDSGIGLESIYAGVNELNGKIAIESTKDEGAFIKIDIPITQI